MECRIIDNVQPFNEIFYRSCFYSSLFPIVNYYYKDVLPVFLNDVTIYDYLNINGKQRLAVRYLSNKNLDDMLCDLGINIESLCYIENLIDNIKDDVQKNKLIIIRADSFYESIRKDTYLKTHLTNSLLIYGYNNINKEINIIEHDHRDYMSYKKSTLNYEEIVNVYKGFHDNFMQRASDPSYFLFSSSDSNKAKNIFDYNSHFKGYKTNINRKLNDIKEGLEKLEKYSEIIMEIVLCENNLNINLEDLIKSLSMIINGKHAEVYKLDRLIGENDEITKLQKKILYNWMLIRNTLVKYQFSEVYIENKYILFFNILEDILRDEKLYYKRLTL